MWWRHILNWGSLVGSGPIHCSHRTGLTYCFAFFLYYLSCFRIQVQNEHMLLVYARWYFHHWLPKALCIQDPAQWISNSRWRPLLLLGVCGSVPQSKGGGAALAWGNLHWTGNIFQSLVTRKRIHLNSVGSIPGTDNWNFEYTFST